MIQRAALNSTNLLVPIVENGLQQQRGMSTLKAISMQLKAIKNIKKITQSMKMVSAAKYTRAERDLRQARPYGEGAKYFYEKTELEKEKVPEPKKLLVAVTSDRGLCGSLHSNVAREIRNTLAVDATKTKVFCIGEKSSIILQRLYSENIMMVANGVGRAPSTFLDASLIANKILTSGYDYTEGKLVYNKFKSIISYEISKLSVFSARVVEKSEKIATYDSLDADVIQGYLEYSLASLIFYTMKEAYITEQSARMTAMDSASKNAGKMIDNLALTFNRTRQAIITGELIEIISGAAALK